MAIQIYRRHRRECRARHAEGSFTCEFEERRKGHRRCDCPIVGSGSIDGKRIRKPTGTWEWEAAKAVVASWHGKPAQPAPNEEMAQERVTIDNALLSFQARAKSKGVVASTLKKYKTFKKQFVVFSEQKGIIFMDQLTIGHADDFFDGLIGKARSKGNKLGMLRAFVKFAMRRKWLKENIAEDLEAPNGVSSSANRTPYTDEELDRIYAACDTIGPPIPAGPGARPWGGEDARDFVFLSIYTGLRISDVCMFDVSKRLHGNNVFLRMHKTKKPLETWIPDFLVKRLRDREKRFGPKIFLTGTSLNVDTVTEQWRRRMGKIFELAEPFDEKPIPHRFRGTFVRILLERGVGEEDVATLIGDTVEVLRKHYSRFVKSRQDRLTRILQDAFQERSHEKVVAIR